MQTLQNTLKDQQKMAYAFWVLALLIVLCAVMYVLMINKTVLNIVASQNITSESNTINSTISQLETQNIALTSAITPEYAASLGFIQPLNPQYISYKAAGSEDLSINTQ